jgi:hypothetical protein
MVAHRSDARTEPGLQTLWHIGSRDEQAYALPMSRLSRPNRNWLIALMVCALAMRMVIPAGWMPFFAGGRAAITLCTGTGMVQAWVDADGKIHKDTPQKKSAKDQPCAFAGLGGGLDVPQFAQLGAGMPPVAADNGAFPLIQVRIGLGLAAPPPPAIGPPILI